MYSLFFVVIYVCLSPSPRAIVSLGAGGNHAVILSSVCFLYYYKACFVWGWVQVETGVCKWILVYRNHFLPQLPHNLWQKSHQHFHLEEALAVLHPLGTFSVSAKPKGDVSSPSHLSWANAICFRVLQNVLYFTSAQRRKVSKTPAV